MSTGILINFPRYNLYNIPEALRTLAQKIESKECSARRVVVVIETDDGDADYRAFGEDFSRAHAAGLCFSIATKLVSE